MSIPYERVLDDEERALSAAFFRALPIDRALYVAALLLIDGRGEPLEFTYNRASIKHTLLWRERDLRHALTRELLTSLLDTCPRDPSVLFCLAAELEADLFADEIDVQRPVARVAPAGVAIETADIEARESVQGSDRVELFWVRGRPSDESSAHRLAQRLGSRGLLLEPFERLLIGLREAYELPELVITDADG